MKFRDVISRRNYLKDCNSEYDLSTKREARRKAWIADPANSRAQNAERKAEAGSERSGSFAPVVEGKES